MKCRFIFILVFSLIFGTCVYSQKTDSTSFISHVGIFGGGGFGFGYASCSRGQNRSLYTADLSISYKRVFTTWRYVKGEEMRITTGFIFPNFDTDNPRETTEERALLVGVVYRIKKFLFTGAAGLSIQNNVNRGAKIKYTFFNYERIETRNTPGFPCEAQIIRTYKYFGLSAKIYFNANRILTTSAILFTIKFGLYPKKTPRFSE